MLNCTFENQFYRTFFFNKCYVQILIVFCIKTEIKLSNEFYPILWLCTWGGFKYVFVRQWVVKWLAWSRGGVWPGKNHKYFKKRKLNIEFQIFFPFNILLLKSYFDIKMLHNIVNKNNINKMFRQKDIFF